ncbi:putative aldouronate transport system substrate-binding protein [Paenibacillus endophyticus]|uniref:Putative aldouronate transport system substrate-binding protein n=1 Tax=Paenibacillus endophyticus TaxID=1294268 RepID=A0A7W5GB64_9BACL|nr:extracellular solute-binding protein [Paenibacillus endophyticus]MBB3153476.1 putative aldouronate transport system substrate-binding protein [Paenibacillus endophyticus]
MKKKLLGLLAIMVVASMTLAACSQNNKPSNTATNAPNAQSEETGETAPVEVTLFAVQEPNIDLATNKFTKFVEEKFNIKIKFETTPPDGAKEKRQISLASGDYPDAYMLPGYVDQFTQADVVKYGKQGVLIPLNDLIDQYAPNIKAAMEKDSDLKAFNTAPDGNIYGLVAYSQCFHCSYPNKMWINTKWLDKLQLEMPKTPEEFKAVLSAFKTKDPNGNGVADEVPLSGSIEDFGVRVIPFLMNGFIYDDDRNYLNLNGGKVESAALNLKWKEGLTYIKSLYDEGLIDPGAFAQNAEAFKKIGENGDAQILGAGAGMHPAIFVNIDVGNKNSADYNPVPPLTGPHGSFATHDGGGVAPGAKFVITNKASEEQQIALIKLVDYMFTEEGQTNGASGMEGIDWRKPKEGEVALGEGVEPKVATIPAVEGEAPRNAGWSGTAHFYMPREYRDSWVQGTDIYDSANYERRLYQATLQYQGHEPKELFPLWAIWIDNAEVDEASILQTNIKSYIEQSALQFITGNKDLERDWDAYVKGLKDLKIDRYLEILQKAYDQSFK